ncbi:hypothetical protein, partial [Klebsiella variicola]|uniref:hypothetical protein n=1 Tax=Klebsiella variicola TaxID=244366 RepID=UPI0027320F32
MGDIVKGSLLVNLTTKEVRELPIAYHALNMYERFAVHGLGYDHVNDDYKVVSPSDYLISYAVELVT